MGKLSDITMNGTNAGKRLSTASMGYQALPDTPSSEKLGNRMAPHFMSPTISSAKQVNANSSSTDAAKSAPLPSSVKARATGNWMSSAVKHVGLSRPGGGNPRSRKEAFLKQPKAISFPDKFATASYVTIPEVTPSHTASPKLDKASLDAKPLPSPPVAQVMSTSPLKQNRSLIDAREKPLRRSPPGKPHDEEDWPVLYPDRPTTPGTLLQMTPERDGLNPATNKVYLPGERYPRLPSLGYESTNSAERKLAPKVATNHQIQRKQVSSPNLRKAPQGSTLTMQPNKENVRPGSATDINPATPSGKHSSTASQANNARPLTRLNNTFGVIAAEDQSATDSKVLDEPRQTRTSSLRARISAGSVIKEKSSGNDKVLGFTDFTAPNTEPLATEKDIKRRSTPRPPGAYPVGPKLSRDSLRGKKPAQFVAGSRRPASRGSLRSESRISAHFSQAQVQDSDKLEVTVAQIPTLNDQSSNVITKSESVDRPEIVPRKSSIPVFRHTVSNVITQADKRLTSEETMSSEISKFPDPADDRFAIFEDNKESHPIASLDAIEESPRQGYHIRRLSILSPEHGPTLKISPSADRIIMGTGSDKENDEPNKKAKDRRRALAPLELSSSCKEKLSTATKTKRVTQSRPSSSQGLLGSTTRHSMVDSESRAMKVRSAEIGSSPTLKRLAIKTPRPSRKNTETSSDDPFYDAQWSIDKRISRLSAPAVHSSKYEESAALAEPEWVAPVQKHLGMTADSDAVLKPSDVQSMMTHEETTADLTSADILSMASHENKTQEISPEPIELPTDNAEIPINLSMKTTEPTPTTPEHSRNATASSRSNSLPPRSSSRTTHPDFVGHKNSPVSPLGNKENVPQAFTERQNRLGSLRGHGTSQIDFANPVSNRNSMRNSVARESNKSQGSISKGMLSNIKGLFHKRSSDEPLPSSNKNGKKYKRPKVAATTNGSPFPPISEIHPVHRPTLASAGRSKANGLTPKSSQPDFATNGSTTPSFNSPAPSELATTTTMALQILESARKERSSPKKERLLELGKILVDAITQARDAEKSLEEAKHAARKAEVSYELCKRSVSEVKRVVEQWRDEMAGDHSR